ncbi:GNAT family N-acetyltransferase [Sporosarcina limicola]|uniref:Ribosomal protein S18 acetylase RimI-like enzyme n=1 Tax=Sporosarcina limicola TaxID=34101 RepID=A0A927RGQ8_9BACL|nr:GNAT family N-acetyltransferase [Sporosarcina limicola]MBE1556742.1 ribosomal protein S18 acetylase RimI-like enzyme [Sporosarcina limicola]
MEFYQANKFDIEGVAQLFDLYRQFYEQPKNLTGAYKFIEERLSTEDSIIFVAKREGEYVGFAQLYPTYSSVSMKKVWILNDLFVMKDERQSGVAQQLLQLAIELCRQTDAKYLTLETAITNEKAQKLYEKNGFVRDTIFAHYELSFVSTDNKNL